MSSNITSDTVSKSSTHIEYLLGCPRSQAQLVLDLKPDFQDNSALLGYPEGSIFAQRRNKSLFRRFTNWIARSLPFYGSLPTAAICTQNGVLSQQFAELPRNRQLETMLVQGLGILLKKPTADGLAFVIDLSIMEKAEVQPGHMRYGCIIHFDQIGNIERIIYGDKTYMRDTVPQSVYAICMASILAYSVIVLDIGLCRLNYVGHTSIMTRRFMQYATEEERAQLEPLQYILGSDDAVDPLTLVAPNGAVERMFAFTHKGIKYLLQQTHEQSSWFHERLEVFRNGCQGRQNWSCESEYTIDNFATATSAYIHTLRLIPADLRVEMIRLVVCRTIVHELIHNLLEVYLLCQDGAMTRVHSADTACMFLRECSVDHKFNVNYLLSCPRPKYQLTSTSGSARILQYMLSQLYTDEKFLNISIG